MTANSIMPQMMGDWQNGCPSLSGSSRESFRIRQKPMSNFRPNLWEAWSFERSPKELCCFALPFGGGSKNAMHITTRNGRKILSDSARKFKADIGILALHASRDVKFK